MDRRNRARRGRNPRRAKSQMVSDVDIVRQSVQDEYDKGTRWAGFAMALVWGPMLALHIMGVF